MARIPKLYTWLEPGTKEHDIVVHAYFHLMQAQRFDGLCAMADITGAPRWMIENFYDQSEGHWHAFEVAISDMPMFRGYLLERHQETIEKRVVHQANCLIRDGRVHKMQNELKTTKQEKRQRKARYN